MPPNAGRSNVHTQHRMAVAPTRRSRADKPTNDTTSADENELAVTTDLSSCRTGRVTYDALQGPRRPRLTVGAIRNIAGLCACFATAPWTSTLAGSLRAPASAPRWPPRCRQLEPLECFPVSVRVALRVRCVWARSRERSRRHTRNSTAGHPHRQHQPHSWSSSTGFFPQAGTKRASRGYHLPLGSGGSGEWSVASGGRVGAWCWCRCC